MPSQQPNDLLLRMAAERRLQLAEARVETVARRVIAGWLTAVQTSILLQASANMTAAGYGWDANAVDAANEYGAWRAGLDAHLLPAVSIVFGEAFQSLRRTDPTSSLQAQQQFIADVSDRLRIWPEGAFEEIRPDLLEAMSDAATFEEMKNRIGAILSVDTQTRDLRAQIGDVDAKLADPDLPDWRRESLTARRAALWNAHDESLSGWEWKARRIARTEAHAAIEAGQLARARAVEEETGDVYYKRWISTSDTRTRPTHVVADGQMVRIGEKFRVGGFLLDFPGDPITIAPQETIQCRCSTAYLDIDAAQAEVQGPKGSLGAVVPGGRRFGPDDPDEARAAVEQVAAERGQSAPADQRGETFGQAQPVDDSSDTIRLYHHTNADAADAIVRDGFTPTYTSLGRDSISDEYKASEGQYGFFTRDPGAAAGYGDRIVAVDVPRDVVDVDPWSGHTRVRVEDLADAQFHHLDEESPIFDVPDDLTGLSDDQLIELMIAAGNADNDVLFERIDAEFDRRSATLDDTRTEAPEEDSGVPDYRTQPEPDDLDDWWGDDDGQPAPDWGIEPDAPQSESDRLVDEFTQALTDNPDITEDEIATWEQRIADAERREADADKARQKQIELWRRIDELAEREGIDDDEARSRITGETIEQIRRSQFVDQAISDGYLGDNRSFDAVLKSVHDDMVAEWYLAAEDATNGQMLRRASEGKFDPSMFWSVNDATARKHMSDELAEWFDENGGRITRNDLRAMIDAGEHTIQQRRGDYLQ